MNKRQIKQLVAEPVAAKEVRLSNLDRLRAEMRSTGLQIQGGYSPSTAWEYAVNETLAGANPAFWGDV